MRNAPSRLARFVAICNVLFTGVLCAGGAMGSRGDVATQRPTERAQGQNQAEKSWWSLQPLGDVAPPNPEGISEAWAKSPIDRFVYANLAEKGLRPSPRAPKRTLIRRVTFDLTGLPPTPQEIEVFLEDDSPSAYEKLIDRLLASPAYGERWGRHWMDVVRFGESTGFERNIIIENAWPFRDYVIQSFNEDKPFNELVLEHLAGDVIGKDNPDVEVGTTFLVAGPYDNVGNQDPVQRLLIRANTIDEMITATGAALFGLTVNCARCHDHKFDPIPQEDYYRLQAALAGVHHGERILATPEEQQLHRQAVGPLQETKEQLEKEKAALEESVIKRAEQAPTPARRQYKLPPVNRRLTEDRFSPVEARYVRLRVFSSDRDPKSAASVQLDEFEVWTAGRPARNVALAGNGGKAEAASRVAEDFADAYSAALTIDGKFGQRWIAVAPVELTISLARPQSINRVVFSSDRSQSLPSDSSYTTFVGEYQIEVSLDGVTWTKAADSYDRPPLSPAFHRERLLEQAINRKERERLAAINRALADIRSQLRAVPPLASVWAGTFRQPPQATYVMKGGDPTKKGPPVQPASVSFLEGVTEAYSLPPDAPEPDRRLALARWIVREDNPLTARVLANRLWHYHFGTGIVDSPSDFGYLGGRPTHPELLDWLARRIHHYRWRLKPLHREIMLSHTYRQSGNYREAAAESDAHSRYLWRFPPRRLSAEEVRDTMLSIAGKLDRKMRGPGFRLYKYIQDNVATYIPLDQHGPETYRRGVYHQNARAARVDLLTDFDCPENAFPAPRRATTTTPLQALTLMNHSFTLDMASFFAARLEQEAGKADPVAQLRLAFTLAYARLPAPKEQKAGVELIREYGPVALCRAILNSNELIYLE